VSSARLERRGVKEVGADGVRDGESADVAVDLDLDVEGREGISKSTERARAFRREGEESSELISSVSKRLRALLYRASIDTLGAEFPQRHSRLAR
jgi:hypothetical protein